MLCLGERCNRVDITFAVRGPLWVGGQGNDGRRIQRRGPKARQRELLRSTDAKFGPRLFGVGRNDGSVVVIGWASSQSLEFNAKWVEEVSCVDDHDAIALEGDARLELGVRADQVEVGVHLEKKVGSEEMYQS